MDLEEELDRLYQQPLKDFVGERNALAKRLQKEREKEAAARVKALVKPSVTAWAVNQLAFSAPDELAALEAVGAEMRAAHLATPAEQQAATAKRRDAVSALVKRAEAVLEEAGQAMSRTHRQRISRTLEALSSRGPDRDEPAAGRLGQDLEPPGFDALADLAAALGQARAERAAKPPAAAKAAAAERKKAPEAEKPRKAEAERRAAREDRRREIARQALDRQLDEARRALAELEEKRVELGREAERAAAELQEAKEARDALSQAALEAERLAREARERADEAGKTASRARFAAESASAAVKRAEGELASRREELERLEKERGRLMR